MADKNEKEDHQERRTSTRNKRRANYLFPDDDDIESPAKVRKCGGKYANYARKLETLDKKGQLSLFKEKEANRLRLYRASLSEEQRKKDNEKTKERMKRYRKRLKENAAPASSQPVLTRKEKKIKEQKQKDLRLYWKTKQQETRSRETEGKKQERLQKERDRYHKNKTARRNLVETFEAETTEAQSVESADYKSQASARKAINRVKRKMPNTPRKWLRVLGGVIKRATPRKKNLLQEAGLVNSPESEGKHNLNESIVEGVKEHLSSTKNKKQPSRGRLVSAIVKHAKNVATIALIRKSLGVQWSSLVKKSSMVEDGELEKSKRSDAISDAEIIKIQEYYQQPHFAIEVPSRKMVSKKTLTAKSVLRKNTKEIHKSYLKEHEGAKISLDKFRKLRPKHVLTANKTHLRQCLCEYCTNVENKLSILKKVNSDLQFKDPMDIVNASLCAKNDQAFHALRCIERKCKTCGVEHLNGKLLQKIGTLEAKRKKVTWEKWENVTIKVKDQSKTKTRKELVTKEGSVQELIKELMSEVDMLASHLFIATWQYKQYSNLKYNLPDGWVVAVADFAENYRTFYQDEIQAAHWQYQQITVHPIVAYYQCPKDSCNELVTASLVCLSDDLIHDASAVHQFFETAIKFLKEKTQISHMVQFTDGCSAQYKSKEPFFDLSCASDDHGFSTERSFFGSRHGKGPCDGLGAVTKQGVVRAVQRREVIVRNAHDMFSYCRDHLQVTGDTKCDHKYRVFFLVKNIEHNRPDRRPSKTYPGTRKLHSVMGVEPSIIRTRNLSCFCEQCTIGSSENCENAQYVEKWNEFAFRKVQTTKSRPVKGRASKSKKNSEQKQTTTDRTDAPIDNADVFDGNTDAAEGQSGLFEMNGNKTGTNFSLNSATMNLFNNNRSSTCKPDERQQGPTNNDNSRSEGSREKFFENLLKKIGKLKEFDQLVVFCMDNIDDVMQYPIQGTSVDRHMMTGLYEVDLHSMELAPCDIPGDIRVPINTVADGNCLPRCGSVYAFGHENWHPEIRVRIVMELALHQMTYLDNNYLQQGTALTTDLKSNFAGYSDMFTPGIILSDVIISRIFEEETKKCSKPGAYMGIWQLFALANVLKCNVMSAYPDFIKSPIRLDMHRLIPTRFEACTEDVAFILWTSTRDDMRPMNWIPNHFTPLLTVDERPRERNDDHQLPKDEVQADDQQLPRDKVREDDQQLSSEEVPTEDEQLPGEDEPMDDKQLPGEDEPMDGQQLPGEDEPMDDQQLPGEDEPTKDQKHEDKRRNDDQRLPRDEVQADDQQLAREEVPTEDQQQTGEEAPMDDQQLHEQHTRNDDQRLPRDEVRADDQRLPRDEVQADDQRLPRDEVQADDQQLAREEVPTEDQQQTGEEAPMDDQQLHEQHTRNDDQQLPRKELQADDQKLPRKKVQAEDQQLQGEEVLTEDQHLLREEVREDDQQQAGEKSSMDDRQLHEQHTRNDDQQLSRKEVQADDQQLPRKEVQADDQQLPEEVREDDQQLPGEKVGANDTPMDDQHLSEQEARFNPGDYVVVKYGKMSLPAIVIKPLEDVEEDEDGIWIQYFKRKSANLWILQTKPYFTLNEEVDKKIDSPKDVYVGKRCLNVYIHKMSCFRFSCMLLTMKQIDVHR